MLCMLKHTLFSCVHAKGVSSIHKITAALANLCISVHYGELNLMLPSASKLQKITFILMKCTKTVATRTAPFGPDMYQIVCRLGLRPRPHWVSLERSPKPPAGLGGGTPRGRGRGRGGKWRGG